MAYRRLHSPHHDEGIPQMAAFEIGQVGRRQEIAPAEVAVDDRSLRQIPAAVGEEDATGRVRGQAQPLQGGRERGEERIGLQARPLALDLCFI